MRTNQLNLLNWYNLVSISKNVVFYTFEVVRIYQYLTDFLQKIQVISSKLKFSEYMLNISRFNVFGKRGKGSYSLKKKED